MTKKHINEPKVTSATPCQNDPVSEIDKYNEAKSVENTGVK